MLRTELVKIGYFGVKRLRLVIDDGYLPGQGLQLPLHSMLFESLMSRSNFTLLHWTRVRDTLATLDWDTLDTLCGFWLKTAVRLTYLN